MAKANLKFGRMVTSVGETALPPNLSPSLQNVDITKAGEATRRKGFVHALSNAVNGEISLIKKQTNYDGTEVYIVIDEDGMRIETE